jgi:hypothetical protein
MKIRNNIVALIFSLLILLLSTIKISAQELEFSEPEPYPCFQRLKVSWAIKPYSKENGEYLYYFKIYNHYSKAVKFEVWFTIGDEKIHRSTPMIPGKGGTWSDGMNLIKSTKNPSCLIDYVCFEGMQCGGKDDCYAECNKLNEKIKQSCASETEESSQTDNESEEELSEKDSVSEQSIIKKTEKKPGASITNLNGKWKSSLNYIKSSNIIVTNEDEFTWDWVVKMMLVTNKGQTHFKRQSGNVFVANNTGTGGQGWCRYVITIISYSKLQVEVFNCAGKLGRTDYLTREVEDIFTHAKPLSSPEMMKALLKGAIEFQHPEQGGKMDFDLTINEEGTVVGVSVLSNPRNKELEDKVSAHIRRQPLVFYHKPAELNGKPVSDNISYSVTYTSYADTEKERIRKANAGENKD